MKTKNSRPRTSNHEAYNDGIRGMADEHYTETFISDGNIIFTFVLIIVAFLIYDLIVLSEETFSIEDIQTDLVNNVHGQNGTVNVVIESLDKMYKHEQNVNIINFIGSTGVGKTYIANIFKKHFRSSIFELNGLLDYGAQYKDVIRKIKSTNSNYNLIVVDDLTIVDVDNLLGFLKEIPQNFVVLVICIFNIQETDHDLNHHIHYDHIDKIKEKFDKTEVPHTVATFREFSLNEASEWVKKQLTMKAVNPRFHSDIVKAVLIGHNVKYYGLKGLSSKINLEL